MRHFAAALLLALGGKEINENNINEILKSVGVKPVASIVKSVVEGCKGKKLEQLIAEGLPKLAGPIGGGAATAPKKEEKKVEEKKVDKKVEKKKEEVVEDGFMGDLF